MENETIHVRLEFTQDPKVEPAGEPHNATLDLTARKDFVVATAKREIAAITGDGCLIACYVRCNSRAEQAEVMQTLATTVKPAAN